MEKAYVRVKKEGLYACIYMELQNTMWVLGGVRRRVLKSPIYSSDTLKEDLNWVKDLEAYEKGEF